MSQEFLSQLLKILPKFVRFREIGKLPSNLRPTRIVFVGKGGRVLKSEEKIDQCMKKEEFFLLIDQCRFVVCRFVFECLDYCDRRNWESFSCHNCPKFSRPWSAGKQRNNQRKEGASFYEEISKGLVERPS